MSTEIARTANSLNGKPFSERANYSLLEYVPIPTFNPRVPPDSIQPVF